MSDLNLNHWPMEEILQGTLSTIYFGRCAYGIQAAAQAYFGKDAADLDVRASRWRRS